MYSIILSSIWCVGRGEDDTNILVKQGGRSCRQIRKVVMTNRVAEVAREHGWHLPKSLDSDENFKPEHTLFCSELRFVAIYALFFEDLWAKKVPFWVKRVLLEQEVHYYMVYIAYFTELILQICDYAQKRRIWRENCK